MRAATLAATILLALVAVAHVVRLVLGIEVTVGGNAVPQWVSGVGILVPGAIAVGLWRDATRAPGSR